MTDTGSLDGNDPDRTVLSDAGRRLKNDYEGMFPPDSAIRGWAANWQAVVTAARTSGFPPDSGWQSAADHGATLRWALQTADATADEAAADSDVAFLVLRSLCLAVEIPVGVIEGLLAAGWDLAELIKLNNLMGKNGYEDLVAAAGGFSGMANRLRALHKTVPGIGGPDGTLLYCALAAVLAADPAGLTDPQALRWLQLVTPKQDWLPERVVLAFHTADISAAVLQEWVLVAGPDGWAWAAAGFTPAETRRLLALPAGHPDQPGPNQLAVMAALRDR